jgi:hypothetical protein
VAAPLRVKQHTIAVEVHWAKSVVVTGSFCDWNPERRPLKYDPNVGAWTTTLNLPPGRYGYRICLT